MARITRAEREMEQLLQLAGLRDDLRKITAERDQLRAENERLRFAAADRECDVTNLTARAEAAEADAAKCRDEYKSLYAQVSAVLRERDEARKAAVDLAKKVGIEKVLAAETARADEASQLLRELAKLLNPHDPYDPSKLLGWARDTVERAREADEAQTQVADLRGALEEAITLLDGWKAREWYGDRQVAHHELGRFRAAIARTPAQSLNKLKAGALRESELRVHLIEQLLLNPQQLELTVERVMNDEADRLEAVESAPEVKP